MDELSRFEWQTWSVEDGWHGGDSKEGGTGAKEAHREMRLATLLPTGCGLAITALCLGFGFGRRAGARARRTLLADWTCMYGTQADGALANSPVVRLSVASLCPAIWQFMPTRACLNLSPARQTY